MGPNYNIHGVDDDKYYYCSSNDCPCNDNYDIFASSHGNDNDNRSARTHGNDPS
jgi:hypothetical protein